MAQTTPPGSTTTTTSEPPLASSSVDTVLLIHLPHTCSYTALRFLVHFVGDVHQPLHLTDRERGGNDDFVRFENRKINLHSLWDTALITKAIREQSNYTKPLPSYVTHSRSRQRPARLPCH